MNESIVQRGFFILQLNRLAGMDMRNAQGATIASILQNFPDHDYVEGESLFTDLMMVLARELTLGYVFSIMANAIAT